MTVELSMLLYSVALTFVLILIPATMQILNNGGAAQAGNRDNLPEPTVMVKRAQRLAANMKENLLMFGALVLLANASGVSTEMTVLGAQLFFYCRIVHAIIYLGGWPWIRPLFWLGGVVGMVMIFLALL
ncbi:MAG: MAPEG family protein [Alphaproteobacteria bacterium]|nr:MAG: MAPEG family protein [Alphaproteobacteria bacterium]